MPGAKWTQKDYEAVAELIAHIGRIGSRDDDMTPAIDDETFDRIVRAAMIHCDMNHSETSNGNSNFKDYKFEAACWDRAHRTSPKSQRVIDALERDKENR